MRYKFYSLLFLVMIGKQVVAQKWDLRKCIDYALANNISIKQTDLQARLAKINAYQSKMSMYPNISFSGNTSYNSGRNQDPTSFNLITESYLSANLQLQSSAEIFNWYSKRNTISANVWELQAALANSEKIRNDIALAVANVYLQVLLSKEQEEIARIQLQQSQSQLDNTRKLVNAGSLPELNAAELEAQVATDSATLINARGNTIQNTLSLKAYMALDAAAPFEIETPPIEKIPVENISDLQPDAVYASAIANLPQQKYNDFKIKAAEKNAAAAKASMYPTFSVSGSLGSAYNSRATEIVSSNKYLTSLGNVTVAGTTYSVFPLDSLTNYSYRKQAFFGQLNQNLSQSIGLSVSVPIFNGASLRSAYQRSKVNVENLQLQQLADNQKLKQDIYQAYNSAMVALEKFNAGKKAVEAAERSYSYSQKRYAVGMLSTLELVTNQNNLFNQRLQNALNQYDYVFKMKVLEFYKGLGLKL